MSRSPETVPAPAMVPLVAMSDTSSPAVTSPTRSIDPPAVTLTLQPAVMFAIARSLVSVTVTEQLATAVSVAASRFKTMSASLPRAVAVTLSPVTRPEPTMSPVVALSTTSSPAVTGPSIARFVPVRVTSPKARTPSYFKPLETVIGPPAVTLTLPLVEVRYFGCPEASVIPFASVTVMSPLAFAPNAAAERFTAMLPAVA